MFGSGVLNVVIGLVFIFLLYSLLASIIQELIASWLGLRAKVLQKGISRMLDDDLIKNNVIQRIRDFTSKKPSQEKSPGNTAPPGPGQPVNAISSTFYDHPLIKYLGPENKGKKPSYLSAQNFSKVVIDLLRGENYQPEQDMQAMIKQSLKNGMLSWGKKTIQPNTLTYLNSLWADAQGDVEKFRKLMEQWFDDTMERATGWYKKKTQLILFIIGFTLAVIFNIDAISITKKLSHHPELAAQLASNASIYVENHKESLQQMQERSVSPGENQGNSASTVPGKNDSIMKVSDSIARAEWESILKRSDQMMDSANALIQTQIRDVNQILGLGWKGTGKHKDRIVCFYCNFHWWSILGWIITALAISLGASFWFDLLNKLMKIRGSIATGTADYRQKDKGQGSSQTNSSGS